jgi:hypothetical protein
LSISCSLLDTGLKIKNRINVQGHFHTTIKLKNCNVNYVSQGTSIYGWNSDWINYSHTLQLPPLHHHPLHHSIHSRTGIWPRLPYKLTDEWLDSRSGELEWEIQEKWAKVTKSTTAQAIFIWPLSPSKPELLEPSKPEAIQSPHFNSQWCELNSFSKCVECPSSISQKLWL